jgi:hypothetical protein
MGWLYNFSMTTRKAIIADRTKGYNSKERSIEDGNENYFVTKCLKHCYKGGPGSGTLWKVMETKVFDVETDFLIKTDLWIGCDLLQWCNRDKCWGYKDLEETMGPHKVNCPLSYLDMVPEPDNEFARDWRIDVRAYHEGRTPTFKPKVGTYVILREGWSRRGPFLLTSVRPLYGNDGRSCHIPRRALLREVTREELDRAKEEWSSKILTNCQDESRKDEMLAEVDDSAIRYCHDFLFASVEKK